ncbi:FlxA-like family protein [Desulfuromonas carbonis]|uniref:hypothetical protein n=1 Tax=Desulfuromonas sp. DDH964 TaxID=1823759 RepID=UPI00078DD22A|nr:hypothetical protein [Desulfuromonas sp. DDH964]AMV71382.1 hypothetical protein DBW_1000 [Desulfuromonas sp. DDH964]
MKSGLTAALALLALLSLAPASGAATVDELERRLDLVTTELQQLKNEATVAEPQYVSIYGSGPAASRIYQLGRGLSVGGYGEAKYTHYTDDQGTAKDRADLVRLILYTGYKFSDKIVLNTELEFEHAKIEGGEEGGEVAVEFAQLDFLLQQKINLRAGLMLVPVGITNEQHEPTQFHGNDRPLVERQVIPATWRELGVGAFGTLADGIDYKLYLVTGLDATGFNATGIRGGRQEGSKATAEDWGVVARLDFQPLLGLDLGASVYLGNSGQGSEFSGQHPDVFTQLYEAHLQARHSGLEVKGLATLLRIDETGLLNGVPSQAMAGYGELAYDLLAWLAPRSGQYLAPFVRVEKIDYQGSSEDVELYVAGLSYKPHPQVVLKADYRKFDLQAKADAPGEINLGLGFIF